MVILREPNRRLSHDGAGLSLVTVIGLASVVFLCFGCCGVVLAQNATVDTLNPYRNQADSISFEADNLLRDFNAIDANALRSTDRLGITHLLVSAQKVVLVYVSMLAHHRVLAVNRWGLSEIISLDSIGERCSDASVGTMVKTGEFSCAGLYAVIKMIEKEEAHLRSILPGIKNQYLSNLGFKVKEMYTSLRERAEGWRKYDCDLGSGRDE